MEMIELIIALTSLVSSLIVLALRNRPNPIVGFRIGYTFNSKRAWRKANMVSGIFSLGYSLVLLVMAFVGISLEIFIFLMVVFVIAEVWLGVYFAKREYELEDLSQEAPEKPFGELKTNIKPYLIIQFVALLFYILFVALYWNDLPSVMATHFDASGNPNGYSPKLSGTLLFPIMIWGLFFTLTLVAKDPGFFIKRRFYPASWKAWSEFMTLMNLGLIFVYFLTVLYNLRIVSGSAISYAGLSFLIIVFLGIYRLLTAG
ncbi:SdpI family protein [Thermococcus sp.]